jgi:hypothetical protein
MSAYLNKLIESYLNDISDYDDDNLVLAESVLKPVKQLITEGKKSQEEILLETYQKSNSKQKEILEDFLIYVREGEI